MRAQPSYENQSLLIERRSVGGHCLFLSEEVDPHQLFEYLLVHYAPRYSIELNLAVANGNRLILGINDTHGRASQFLAAAYGIFIRTLNKLSKDRKGTRIQPGHRNVTVCLDAEAEMEAHVEAATLAALDITPTSTDWSGTLFTPAQAGLERCVKRPDCLNPKVFTQDEITYTVAAPKFLGDTDLTTFRSQFARDVTAREIELQEELEAEGKHHIGLETAARLDTNTVAPLPPPKRGFFAAKDAKLLEHAYETLRTFRKDYQTCIDALRAGKYGFEWPAGTNFHHFINGFPRERLDGRLAVRSQALLAA